MRCAVVFVSACGRGGEDEERKRKDTEKEKREGKKEGEGGRGVYSFTVELQLYRVLIRLVWQPIQCGECVMTLLFARVMHST